MSHRTCSRVASAALLLALAVPVAAMPPERIPFTVNDVFPSRLLTRACGTGVVVRVQGTGTMLLFYDHGGQLVREIEVVPGGFTWTYEAGTGKSFTQTVHTQTTYLFPEGVFEGAVALAIFHGVQHTSGAGSPRIVGRAVHEAVVEGISAQGVPLLFVGDPVFEAGQFDVGPVIAARCALLVGP